MHLLVTGGAGFIGANFVHQVLREHPDARLTVLDAFTYAGNRSSLAPVADRIDVVEGDVADAGLVEALVGRLTGADDAVVHFAAESHNDNSLRDPEPFVRTNLVGTFTILEAVRRHGVRLHHISTDEVYGDLEAGGASTETDALRPSSPYSAAKASGDLLVSAYARTFGVNEPFRVVGTINARTWLALSGPWRSSKPITAILPAVGPPRLPPSRAAFLSLCMKRAAPPMNVSSASTRPCIFWNVPVRIASRIRWSMNHAVFCVTPIARWTS